MRMMLVKVTCLAIAALLALAATSLSQSHRLAIAVAVGLPSFVLIVVCRRQIGTSFSFRAEARKLVTTGLYSKLLHPMYLFVDLFLLSVVIVSGWPILLILWGVFVVLQTRQARKEEKVLAGTLGDEYLNHKSRVWF